MKALYNLLIGVIGGILGIGVIALLWLFNTIITIGADLCKAARRKS